jgi:NAD(P)-dependent dehydrogenase (short-subunit alcohol dehydrogenase family)
MLRRIAPWDGSWLPDQTGRVAMVTGASSGVGLSVSEALAANGAQVLMACRDPAKAEEARRAVASAASDFEPEIVRLDLADLASVREAVEQAGELVDRLDLLINNAGVMFTPPARTVDGFEIQFGTNHLGHFALTGLAAELLLSAPAPRVVTVSSNVNKVGRIRWSDPNGERLRRYQPFGFYAQSKVANTIFALELDRRARAEGSTMVSVAAHPGMAPDTDLKRHTHPAAWKLLQRGLAPLCHSNEMAALPELYAAAMPDVRGGEFYAPRGLFEGAGAPKLVRARRVARDSAAGRRLWRMSEELTGVSYPSLAPVTSGSSGSAAHSNIEPS